MKIWTLLLVPALAAGLAACGTATRPAAGGAATPGGSAPDQPRKKQRPPAHQSPADIAAHSTPAIVTVRTPDGLGTGFVVRQDGWIATNYHVIDGAQRIVVVLSDKRELPVVEIVNASRSHDLAILHVDARHLPVLALGDSDTVRPGDPVVAIGHPLGLEDTVSNGLVSAVRHVDNGLEFLQISAPIAPGSSGGPLFNDRGEVIGVATAILRGGQNLNLALPVNYVKELVAHPDPVSMLIFAAAMAALTPEHPTVVRHVPHHPVEMLDGCSPGDMAGVLHAIGEAIEVGAPLYNHGNPAACFHVYVGAAEDLEHKLPRACAGPRKALAAARARAEKLDSPDAQAWAMRDAFDGLIEVIVRRAQGQ